MIFSYHAPTKSLALLTLIAFLPMALLPEAARAEMSQSPQSNRFEKDGYVVEEISFDQYKISSEQVELKLEVLSGDRSVMRINGKLFSFENEKSQKYNERKLAEFLKQNVSARTKKSKDILSFVSNLLFPSAHALNWWAIGLGLVGVVGIIIGIKAMKDADKNDERNDAIFARKMATYDERIAYQNCMGDRFSGKSEEACDGSHK